MSLSGGEKTAKEIWKSAGKLPEGKAAKIGLRARNPPCLSRNPPPENKFRICFFALGLCSQFHPEAGSVFR
jgi:hypothetical protein